MLRARVNALYEMFKLEMLETKNFQVNMKCMFYARYHYSPKFELLRTLVLRFMNAEKEERTHLKKTKKGEKTLWDVGHDEDK